MSALPFLASANKMDSDFCKRFHHINEMQKKVNDRYANLSSKAISSSLSRKCNYNESESNKLYKNKAKKSPNPTIKKISKEKTKKENKPLFVVNRYVVKIDGSKSACLSRIQSPRKKIRPIKSFR